MSKLSDEIKHLAQKSELIEQSTHKKMEAFFLLMRNTAVLAAVVLFVIGIFNHEVLFKAVAYFCGAAAYLLELLALTDGFRTKVPHNELFMVYCFGPLYILLGISILIG